jgi:hypothetical protein
VRLQERNAPLIRARGGTPRIWKIDKPEIRIVSE